MRPSSLVGLIVLSVGALGAAVGCTSSSSTVVVATPGPISAGSSVDAQIMVTGGGTAGHRLTSASCDDGCVVTIIKGATDSNIAAPATTVNVRLLRPGTFTLRFKVVTDDGDELGGSHAFTAIEPTDVTVERLGVQIKANDVVLEGTSLSYDFHVLGPGGSQIPVSWEGLSLTFQGLDPVSASLGDASSAAPGDVLLYPEFIARQSGAGTVAIHAGSAVGTHGVRIASAADVVSTSLHRMLEGNEIQNGDTYESAPFDGTTWTDTWHQGVELVPVSTLADGTLAVGGAASCTIPTTPGVQSGGTGGLSFLASADQDVQATVTISCVIGAAHVETSVHLKGFGT